MFIRCGNRIPVNIEMVRTIPCAHVQAKSMSPYIEPEKCYIEFTLSGCGNNVVWNFPDAESLFKVYHKIMDMCSQEITF